MDSLNLKSNNNHNNTTNKNTLYFFNLLKRNAEDKPNSCYSGREINVRNNCTLQT